MIKGPWLTLVPPLRQELATVAVDALPTKMFILNNQHLGMVVQWEDRFYKANRAHTYLGRRVCSTCHQC